MVAGDEFLSENMDEEDCQRLTESVDALCDGHHLVDAACALAMVLGGVLSNIEEPHRQVLAIELLRGILESAADDDEDTELDDIETEGEA